MDTNNLINDFIGYLIQLSGNEYAQKVLLYFVVACWLVAIAGGGLIKIADKQIGRLKVPARIVSFALGIVALIIYISIPSPNLKISGIFSESTFPKIIKQTYQIRLTPAQLVKEADVGEEGFFQFVPSDEVKKGRYYISVLKDNEVIFNKEYTIDPNLKNLLVYKKRDTYVISREKVVDYFTNIHTTSRRSEWMKRYRAERILRDIAKREHDVKNSFLEKIESGETNREKLLACWVLGGLVHEQAKDDLINILENKDGTYSPFDQIKAAFFISQYYGKYPGKSDTFFAEGQKFLIKLLMDHDIKYGLRDVTDYAHGAAAFYLTDMNVRCKLVYDGVFPHIRHEEPEIIDAAIEKLQTITGRDDLKTPTDWESLKDQERAKLSDCPSI